MMFTMPFNLANLANKREYWAKRAKRAKMQRWGAHALAHEAFDKTHWTWDGKTPLAITITRIGQNKRPMDTDGLAIACKHVRDGIADELGVDDNNKLLSWHYLQRYGKYGVEVSVEPLSKS